MPKSSRKSSSAKITLERVIGLTASSHSALSIHPLSDHVAYPAGCVVVVYSIRKNKQVDFLTTDSCKAIHSVAYSDTGRFLAAGESGHNPAVIVWDMNNKTIMATLSAHKYGVACLSWSPDSDLLASVGFQPDGQLLLWDWQAEQIIASNTSMADKILSLSFSSDGRKLATAGSRHVHLWQIEQHQVGRMVPEPAKLEGTSVVLGSHSESIFYDVASARGVCSGQMFGITSRGLVCQLGGDQQVLKHDGDDGAVSVLCLQVAVERFVDLKVKRTFAVCVGKRSVACGCSDGVIRMFEPSTMKYMATLPRPHAQGHENRPESQLETDQPLRHADVIALQLTPDESKLVAIYSDRSLYVWNIENLKGITKARSFLAHSGCVWDLALPPKGAKGIPEGSFVTCGSDNTVRMWNVAEKKKKDAAPEPHCSRSMYCREMLVCKTVGEGAALSDAANEGLRCVTMSCDGSQVACGDHDGKICVMGMPNLETIASIEAHDGEVMQLCYSNQLPPSSADCLLASSGRDRIIHLLHPQTNFALKGSVADHSGAVTSVRFASNDSKLLSCSTDKSIRFRDVSDCLKGIASCNGVRTSNSTIYDMDLDATHKYLVTANADKRLNVWSANSTKSVRTYRLKNTGEPYKVQLDPAGIFVATSSSDKHLRVYDFFSGDFVAKAGGHSEQITRLRFTHDCRRLISVGADGCIFVHKLSSSLAKPMLQRMAELDSQASTPASSRGDGRPSTAQVPRRMSLPTPELSSEPQRPSTAQVQRPAGAVAAAEDSRPNTADSDIGEESCLMDEADEDCSVILSDGEEEASFQFRGSLLPAWAKPGGPSGAKPEAAAPPRKALVPQGKWVSDGAVQPKELPGTLPAAVQLDASDDVVCEDIDSEESEENDVALPTAPEKPEDNQSLFRVSLKGDALPKVNFNEDQDGRERVQCTQQQKVDVVQASMEQLVQETDTDTVDAGPSPSSLRASRSGRSSKNPLRQSLTSGYLQKIVAEVGAEVDAIKHTPSKAVTRPQTAAPAGHGFAHGFDSLSNVPVSGELGGAVSQGLSASTLASEREVLKNRAKQKNRLASLNQSFAESQGLKGSIAEADVRKETEGEENGAVQVSPIERLRSEAAAAEAAAAEAEAAAEVAVKVQASDLSVSDLCQSDHSPIQLLQTAVDDALDAFKRTLDDPTKQGLQDQYRKELSTMSAKINSTLAESSIQTEDTSSSVAVDNVSGNPAAVNDLLDKLRSCLGSYSIDYN